MKTLKIVLALAAVIGLVTVTVGLSFAHYTGTIPFNPTTNTDTPFDTTPMSVYNTFDQDWWTRMRDYMKARWTGIEDEIWFIEMTQYMEEHYNEVRCQAWFDQMLEYMEDRGYYHYGYRGYADNYYSPNYYGPRSSGRRGFGCWGW
jgi:hypothetical protein